MKDRGTRSIHEPEEFRQRRRYEGEGNIDQVSYYLGMVDRDRSIQDTNVKYAVRAVMSRMKKMNMEKGDVAQEIVLLALEARQIAIKKNLPVVVCFMRLASLYYSNRRLFFWQAMEDEHENCSPAESAEDLVVREEEQVELRRMVQQYLDHMPERVRRVWEMRLDGDPTDLIARQLGCTRSYVNKLLKDGIETVKELLVTTGLNDGGMVYEEARTDIYS